MNYFAVSTLFFLSCLYSRAEGSLVPALYIFGDSIVDAGNNNYLNTSIRANMPPYGIDFSCGGFPTGRATNGYTVPDFFASWMGLPLVPPVLQCANHGCRSMLKGFNFASASSGILPETTSAHPEILFLSRQIDLFAGVVNNYLVPTLGIEFSHHINKSLFLFCSGSNDFTFSYLALNKTNRPKPEKFAEKLCDLLGQMIRSVYNLGGRKFVVFGTPTVGCPPNSDCTPDPSAMSLYNSKLEGRLKELTHMLPNSTILLANLTKIGQTVMNDPSRYGFRDIINSCVKDKIPCPNRDEYLLWDGIHATEAAYKIFAMAIFNGSGYSSPLNVLELIKL